MKFMTKFKITALSVLFLSSCSSINLGYIEIVRDRFKGNKIDNLDQFFKTNYSFIRVSRNRNQAIFILSNYDNGIETWVGANKEIIITYKGIILLTEKLEKNITHHNINEVTNNFQDKEFMSYVSMENPSADYLLAKFSEVKDSSYAKYNSMCPGKLIIYKKSVETLKFKSDIVVCSHNENTKFSLQKFHPKDDPLFIEFFYL